jgi:DNA-binding MarR family transcriptional regulator
MKMSQEEKIKVRRQILSCMDQLPRTTVQIQKLMQRGGMICTTSKVGNNLKYLEDKGYVTREKDPGTHRFLWIKIKSEEYDEEALVDILVQVPIPVKKELDRLAKLLDTNKSAVVRDALKEQLGV